MASSTDFSAVKLTLSTATGKVTGTLTGQATTTTTYPPETVHATVGLTSASGATGSIVQDVVLQKPPTSAPDDVKITSVTDTTGRVYTIAADGKSFTS